MALPLIPIAIIAGSSFLGAGSYFGLVNKKPDEINNITKQNTYQYDYISNETIFDFGEANFETGSNVDLRNYTNVETSKNSNQEAKQTGKITDNTILYIAIATGIIGTYLYFRGKK